MATNRKPLQPEEMVGIEAACIQLFGHEYWQVLNDTHLDQLAAHIRGEEPCGYCGDSQDPNDMCLDCHTAM